MRAEGKRFFLGCSGYFYWGWRGRFYPENLKSKDWLSFYAGIFNTVELNSTFYSFPKRENLKRLKRSVPEGFTFSVKANRSITHLRRFRETEDMIEKFYLEVSDGLGNRLGPVLFQMPPSYRYSEDNLERILKQLKGDFINVLEFRHTSWWREEVFSILRSEGVVFCSVSFPGLPEELVETSNKVYIRFHGKEGKYRYRYSKEELKIWAESIRGSGAEEVYVYFNNDYNANAPDNCRELMNLLRIRPYREVS